jgi:hypothetical protein
MSYVIKNKKTNAIHDKAYDTMKAAKSAKTKIINKIVKNSFVKQGENYIMLIYRKKELNDEWVIVEKL